MSADTISSVEAEELARTGVDVGEASTSGASLGTLVESPSDSTRFGSGGPRSGGSQVSYQWHMAPWTSGRGSSGVFSEVSLVPMRATLLPVVAAGGPTQLLVRNTSAFTGGRVTRSGRYTINEHSKNCSL